MLELDDDFIFINWWYCASYFMRRNSPRMTTRFEQTYRRYLPAEIKPPSNDQKNIRNSLRNKPFLTVKTYT